jgi:hypothetical protein
MGHPQGPGGCSSPRPAPRIFLATAVCQSGKPLQTREQDPLPHDQGVEMVRISSPAPDSSNLKHGPSGHRFLFRLLASQGRQCPPATNAPVGAKHLPKSHASPLQRITMIPCTWLCVVTKAFQCNQREIVRDGAPGLPLCEIRVVLVVIPARGITQDVFADGGQFLFVANDVFVEPALPQSRVKRRQSAMPHAHDVFMGCHGFECLHDTSQGPRRRSVGAILVIARMGWVGIIRANTRFAPTGFRRGGGRRRWCIGDGDDGVDVVGHYHECVWMSPLWGGEEGCGRRASLMRH